MEQKNDQNFWHFVLVLLFLAVFALSVRELERLYGGFPQAISLFDLVLIVLATFRLTRLFVYDKITQFLRDPFLKKRSIEARDGTILIERTKYVNGPLRAISDLLDCPWCIGVWVAPGILFTYYTVPFAWFVIAALAVAGVAAFLQILSNMVGWNAELSKVKVAHESTETDVANRHC